MTNQELFDKYTFIDWSSLCKYEQLSEGFIREFENDVDWNMISYSQTLSENFIRKYAHHRLPIERKAEA